MYLAIENHPVEQPAIALFEELLQIPGERCAKQVVRRHESEAVVVPWPESAP